MEIGWSELLVIGVVALIVIGPKDLPEMFRTLGRFTAKMRAMAREFSRAMEDAAKESGVKDVADDLRKATSPRSMGLDAVKSAADRFEKWDPLKAAKSSVKSSVKSAVTTPATPAATGSETPSGTGTVAEAEAKAGAKPAEGAADAAAASPVPGAGGAEAAGADAAESKTAGSNTAGPNTAALAGKLATRREAAARTAAQLREDRATTQPRGTKTEKAAPGAAPRKEKAGAGPASPADPVTGASGDGAGAAPARPRGRRRKPSPEGGEAAAPAGEPAAGAAAKEK